MKLDVISGIIRHTVSGIGTVLITIGVLDKEAVDMIEVAVGSLLVTIGLTLSVLHKLKNK